MMTIKDSGNRTMFESGAVRDLREGKGREDLAPLEPFCELLGLDTGRNVVEDIHSFMIFKEPDWLLSSLKDFCEITGWDYWEMMLEVGVHFEEGAKKYGTDNWRKGIPLHCYIDSALRHFYKYMSYNSNKDLKFMDERHDRAFVWNILCAYWTFKNRPEYDDISIYDRLTDDDYDCDEEYGGDEVWRELKKEKPYDPPYETPRTPDILNKVSDVFEDHINRLRTVDPLGPEEIPKIAKELVGEDL